MEVKNSEVTIEFWFKIIFEDFAHHSFSRSMNARKMAYLFLRIHTGQKLIGLRYSELIVLRVFFCSVNS